MAISHIITLNPKHVLTAFQVTNLTSNPKYYKILTFLHSTFGNNIYCTYELERKYFVAALLLYIHV